MQGVCINMSIVNNYAYLVLNSGYCNTKVITQGKKALYETKAIEQEETDGKTLVTADGRSFAIGDGLRDLTKKQDNEVQLLCSEYAILKYAASRDINIVTTMPANMFLNKEYRLQFQQSYLGIHRGWVDGVYKEVEVHNCKVVMEGAAAYIAHKQQFNNSTVGILDIGGNTINLMIYQKDHVLKDTIATLDLGTIKLSRELIDKINISKGWNVQDYELQEILQEGSCNAIVDKEIAGFVKRIKQALQEKRWNIERIPLFATGGGALLLEQELIRQFNNIRVSQTGLWDNALGLNIIGGQLVW